MGFKSPGTEVDIPIVAKKGKAAKSKRVLGPSTVVRPALVGAAILFVVQTAMHVFLKA